MSFTSITFAVFFIALLLVYYLTPKKTQWIWLLLGSYIFYAWVSPPLTLFLLFSTFSTWFFSLRQKKLLIFFCLLLNLGLLFFIKYANFFISIANPAFDGLTWIVLPLGISFYTFQSLGYAIDVYRGTIEPQKNFLRYALYVSFFPQICQGPIGRYESLAPQLFGKHRFNYSNFTYGLTRILLGLLKKLVIANRLGAFIDALYAAPTESPGILLVFATILYAFQLYADFSGYMDIAIGIGECFGIRLDENFKTPYFSRSVAEFWRRWHITLGSWFKDYLYYPLLRSAWLTSLGKKISANGHRKLAQLLTTSIGLAIVWLLIGMWHGASANFILYGAYYGFFIILSTVLAKPYEKWKHALHISDENKLWRLFQGFRTFTLVCIAYILFRAPNLSIARQVIAQIIKRPFLPSDETLLHTFLQWDVGIPLWFVLAICFLLLLPLEIATNKNDFRSWFSERSLPLRWGILYALTLLILFCSWFGVPNAGNFLYFNF